MALIAALLAVLALASSGALAASWEADTVTGVMEQPTSHYYHLIFGASVQGGTTSEGFLVKGTYWQRPTFEAAGYADQDEGWWGMVGTKVTKEKDRGLYAYAGFGRVGGWVKDLSQGSKSTYLVNGPVFDVEYALHFGHFSMAVGHQQFIGYVSKFQVDAYVAWPYSFYTINLGATL